MVFIALRFFACTNCKIKLQRLSSSSNFNSSIWERNIACITNDFNDDSLDNLFGVSINSLNSLNLIWCINLFSFFFYVNDIHTIKKATTLLVSHPGVWLGPKIKTDIFLKHFVSRVFTIVICFLFEHPWRLLYCFAHCFSFFESILWSTPFSLWTADWPWTRDVLGNSAVGSATRVLARLVRIQPGNGQQFCSVK